jgi:hypothetical protein
MSKISKSPERNTFQKNNYIKRCEKEGKEPRQDYLDMWDKWNQQDEHNLTNPEWQKNNMEYDMRSSDWFVAKVKASDTYAQNLYAAMCNNEFQKLEVIPILKEERWSASWRSAGGIVADMREEGDYIDWYCSGIGNDEHGYGLSGKDGDDYVAESVVTNEIRNDLKRLGWIVIENTDD